jgi:hypothetical protein
MNFEAGHEVMAISNPDGSFAYSEDEPTGGLWPFTYVHRIETSSLPSGVTVDRLQLTDYEWTQIGGEASIPAYKNAIADVSSYFNGQPYNFLIDNSNTFITDVTWAGGGVPPSSSYWAPLTPVAGCFNRPCGPWSPHPHH